MINGWNCSKFSKQNYRLEHVKIDSLVVWFWLHVLPTHYMACLNPFLFEVILFFLLEKQHPWKSFLGNVEKMNKSNRNETMINFLNQRNCMKQKNWFTIEIHSSRKEKKKRELCSCDYKHYSYKIILYNLLMHIEQIYDQNFQLKLSDFIFSKISLQWAVCMHSCRTFASLKHFWFILWMFAVSFSVECMCIIISLTPSNGKMQYSFSKVELLL